MFYLALSSSRPDFNPESLTPRFMLWQPARATGQLDDVNHANAHQAIWLLDLRPVWPYWCHQAGISGHKIQTNDQESLHAFLRQAISLLAGEGALAVMDASPWRALMGIEVMRERGLDGFVFGHNPIGRNLVNEASWDIWFRLADEVALHWFGCGRERFNLQVFRRQAHQMAQGMERLGIRNPVALVEMPALAIRRRYGAALHDLWLWTANLHGDDESGLIGFPWVLWRQQESIQVKRHLDTPLLEWEHIETVLRDDVDRLCAQLEKLGVGRVLSLEWRVVFLDLSCLVIPIRFRHPHDLPAESPHHRTALLQACYAFEDAIPTAMGAAVDLGLYEKAIGSWELLVTEKIILPPVMRDLFGSIMDSGEDRLQELENRLPVPLNAYEVTSNWIPEDGYCLRIPGHSGDPTTELKQSEDVSHPSLQALGLRRPLFVYPKPRACPQPVNHSRGWSFCERIMDKWWRSGSASIQGSMQRDYYMMRDEDERSVWVFKDGSGKWYVHGMYN